MGDHISRYVACMLCKLTLQHFENIGDAFENCVEMACLHVDDVILHNKEFMLDGSIEGGSTLCG